MNTSLLKTHPYGCRIAAALLISLPAFGATASTTCNVPASRLLSTFESEISNNLKGIESMRSLFGKRNTASIQTPKKEPAVVITPNVKTEVVVNEDFSKWTKGTATDPNPDMVTDEEAASLMNYPGDWTLFRMYEAGGNGFMGFDEVGDDGPGYIMSPAVDVTEGETSYFRFTARVKNVNENAQDQGLQAFFMNGEESSILFGSTKTMVYDEWTECEWIGRGCSTLQPMVFGWKGKVLIDSYKIEKLIFPLATPVVTSATYTEDGVILLKWNKVEGATSYKIEVQGGSDTVYTTETGDTDSCVLDFIIDPSMMSYVFYVTAVNGEDMSYPGYIAETPSPETVGTAVALDATDITADGFTANWQKADYAARYLVLPTLTHKAKTAGEQFFYLNELFANVPENADAYNAIQIAPMLGMGGTDLYMSRAGWTIDMGVFMRMIPEMPALALTNMYAAYGLEGSLTSPVADYSVGNGTVKVSGMALSATDDVVMTCGFIDADGNMYSSQDFEITVEGTEFDVELTGGKADSRFVLKITDATEEGDMALIPYLNIYTTLNEGDVVTVPAETVFVDNNTDNARVEVTVDEYNNYSYSILGYFSAKIMGGISNSIDVSSDPNAVEAIGSASASARIIGGILRISNPESVDCTVYTADGRLVFSTSDADASFTVERGSYIVRLGDKAVKLVY